MHLCQKFGYEQIAEINLIKEKEYIEKNIGNGAVPFGMIVPRINDEGVKLRMRGETIRNEYYVKER